MPTFLRSPSCALAVLLGLISLPGCNRSTLGPIGGSEDHIKQLVDEQPETPSPPPAGLADVGQGDAARPFPPLTVAAILHPSGVNPPPHFVALHGSASGPSTPSYAMRRFDAPPCADLCADSPNTTPNAPAVRYDGMQVMSGWSYLRGRFPQVRTPRVCAGSRGTTLVAQVERTSDAANAPEIHRIYIMRVGPNNSAACACPGHVSVTLSPAVPNLGQQTRCAFFANGECGNEAVRAKYIQATVVADVVTAFEGPFNLPAVGGNPGEIAMNLFLDRVTAAVLASGIDVNACP